MKLEIFQEKKNKKIVMIVGIVSIVILLAVVFLYRTYSIYQESENFDVIKGSVPNQNYDVRFAFYLIDETGNKSMIQTIPEGKEYEVEVVCNNEAVGVWDKEIWGPRITNLTNTRTKCSITFSKITGPLKDYGINESVVVEGSGLYEVEHSDANITYTTNTTAINNLKMTEYRYAGVKPNNYVLFNGELWRIIGLVNTPEGQRIKLIRDESIGSYSWDSSASNINNGFGVNEWSQSKIKELLNEGAYYNRTNGSCYNGQNNAVVSCDFSSNGLTVEAKGMIDTITWNVGTNGYSSYATVTEGLVSHFYNYERSNNVGKICDSGSSCNDSISRTISWKGQVGLISPSDYGYATDGGSTGRKECLQLELYNWGQSNLDCSENNWLKNITYWTMVPVASTSRADTAFVIFGNGRVDSHYTYTLRGVRPVIHLNQNIKFIDGEGTSANPYVVQMT